jgi:ABC-2 type transport system permease protein
VKLNRLRFEGCLRWLSPFRLLELSQPYAANRWTPVVVLAGYGGGDAGRDSWSPPRRDLHGGLLTQAVGRAPRRALLGSVSAFALRRTLRPLAGWSAAIGAYYLLIGLIADSMTGFLAENPRLADLAAQAGFAGLGSG